jgi:hypothetical protein
VGSLVSPWPYLVRTGRRLLLGINGGVLCGGGQEVKEKCTYCGEVMRPGLSFYGDYCATRQCFNSEGERVLRGPRINRRKEEDSK